MFGNYTEGNAHDRELIIPHTTLASWVEVCPTNKKFRSGDWLKWFSEKVYPLDPGSYGSKKGCRPLLPKVDQELMAKRDLILPESIKGENWQRVRFRDGSGLSRRVYQAEVAGYGDRLREGVQDEPESYPRELAELRRFLNEQPVGSQEKLLKRNWAEVRDYHLAMPVETEHQRIRRDATFRVLFLLQDYRRLHYKTSDGSTRLYTAGTSIHQLPKEVRKLALKGSVALDLQACQLAIVSKLWSIPSLHQFLGNPKNSVWQELCQDLGVDGEAKPLLKQAVYGITFGMRAHNVKWRVAKGSSSLPGLGDEVAAAFMTHRLIAPLLEARNERKVCIREEGGVTDAFGRWLPLVPELTKSKGKTRRNTDAPIRSLLAQEVQSHEIKLMAAMLPVLQKEKDIRIVSFLHDGISIHITDPSEKRRKLRGLKDAVNDEAERCGFPTRLVED